MKRVFLCGNTGGDNRGCEAIIRSTQKVLKLCGIDEIAEFSFSAAHDKEIGLNEIMSVYSYDNYKNQLQRIYYAGRKILCKDWYSGMSYHHKTMKSILSEGDVTLNVGGDTYCYGVPYMSYTLNRITEERKIKNIFWGCSVDESLTNDLEKQKDVNRYFKIITRESYTKNLMDSVVNDKEKVLLACDPAFQLDIKKTELPRGFLEGNTVGINISHLMYNEKDRFDESAIYANIIKLIDYIIEKTDMNVCLVPHVYNIKNNTGDICVLKELKAVYADNSRVSIVDKELNCCELKYIISKLRFFIGARTHSVIAAYSTNVPAIALSYSIKSRGIAYDLFGKEEGYVISWKNLTSADILLNMFTDLMKNEKEIKEHYEAIMPKYKESIVKTAKGVLEEAFCGK